jgi:hypothetical protein
MTLRPPAWPRFAWLRSQPPTVSDTWNFRRILFEVQEPLVSNPLARDRFKWTIYEPTFKTEYPMSHYTKSSKYVIGYDYTKPGAVFDAKTLTVKVSPTSDELDVEFLDSQVFIRSKEGAAYVAGRVIEPEAVPPFNPDSVTYASGGCLPFNRFSKPRPDWQIEYDSDALPPQVAIALTYIQSRKDFRIAPKKPEVLPPPAPAPGPADGGDGGDGRPPVFSDIYAGRI